MSFADDLRAFQATVAARSFAIFLGTVAGAHESITVGSPLTGSKGQPVDTGFLRNSWAVALESDHAATIATSASYAAGIEDGISSHGTPIRFRSKVGGPFSVRLTIAGLDRIVEDVTKRVTSGSGGGDAQ